MASIEYTAIDRGEIISGHSAGSIYFIDFTLASASRAPTSVKSISRAMDGSTQSRLYSYDNKYTVTTDIVIKGSIIYNQWLEFFSSVKGAEIFTLDLSGTNAAPSSKVMNVFIEGEEAENDIDNRLAGFASFTFTVVSNDNL